MAVQTITERMYNFSAGPAVLPVPVLEEAQRDLVSLPGAGASILEISHRSKSFDKIIEGAESTLREVMGIPNNYTILFLQGGASMQFSMIPMNFLRGTGKDADYIRSGSWAKKAISEAKKEGSVNVIWNGEDEKFTRMPVAYDLKVNKDAAYVHMTSNETIEGVEFQFDPDTGGVPLICDSSSDIMSRRVDISKYAVIYSGAQKNMGPSGVTLVIMRNDMLEKVPSGLHTMLDYKIMAENKSLYNTPPVFAIYLLGLVGKWVRDEIGGLDAMSRLNKEKAALIYETIDNSGGYYRGHAQKNYRSNMNVTFRMPNEELEEKFAKEATAIKLDGLKGHRSVGGLRASIYNAFPLEGVHVLIDFMKVFQRKNG